METLSLRSVGALLERAQLLHLSETMGGLSLHDMDDALTQSRTQLLAQLKEHGVAKVGERQEAQPVRTACVV